MKNENAKPKMILRWFYGGDDSVTLEQIRQIPGVTGVCTALTDVPVGEVWPLERLQHFLTAVALLAHHEM